MYDVHLNVNTPITVGIHYDSERINNERTTDHFAVTTEEEYDSEVRQFYYTFMDCGTTKADEGCYININRFYYDDDSYYLSGTTAYMPRVIIQ